MGDAPSLTAARRRPLIRAALVGLCSSSPFVAYAFYCSYRAYRPDGDAGWLWTSLFAHVPLLLGLVVVTALSLVGLFVAAFRQAAQAGCVWVVATVVGLIILPSGGIFRDRGMRTIAANAEPVVVAIGAFHTRHREWPPRLEALVPEFIAEIPSTGLAAYPQYQYTVGESARMHHFGNPWVLFVATPSGGINFDLFLYYPLQSYPAQGHGGSLERMGKWAYVHE